MPVATAEKDGLMSKKDKICLGDTYGILCPKNNYLKITNLDLHYKHSYIDLRIMFTPTWETSSPICIMISLNDDNGSNLNVIWKCYCGESSWVEFYKKDNILYMKNKYSYNISVFATCKGFNETILELIPELLDAEVINEAK